MVGWTSFIFGTDEFIHYRPVLVNMNILPPKIEALQMGTKQQNGKFLENGSDSSDSISVILLSHRPKWNCTCEIFWKITLNALEAQMIMHHTHMSYLV
jgi:hypothetical protein